MMRPAWVLSLLVATAWMPLRADDATGAPSPGTRPTLQPAIETLDAPDIEALFLPGVEPARRDAARRQAVRLAMAGDGYAAFQLGVLFRHGMDHPARAVERDLDTARYWLEKCIDSMQCPDLALASLAELELDAGDHRAAMQWAQAWAVVWREVHGLGKRPGQSSFRPESYTAYLLKRCFEHLPRNGRAELVEQAFAEFQQRRGSQLQRMATRAASTLPLQEQRRAESAAARFNHPVQASTRGDKPSSALYLMRAAPAGGRSEQVTLIEALPSPRDALALNGIARRWEWKPYAPATPGERRYGFMPVEMMDPRYVIDLDE